METTTKPNILQEYKPNQRARGMKQEVLAIAIGVSQVSFNIEGRNS
jgi:hypothetical protein